MLMNKAESCMLTLNVTAELRFVIWRSTNERDKVAFDVRQRMSSWKCGA
jgi:hypothetical protein